MAGSDRGALHIDQALTNMLIGFKNSAFIADQVLPVVPVNKESDKYFKLGKEHLKIENDIRADGTPSNKVRSWTISNSTYTCETHSLHDVVTERMRSNADAPIQPDITTAKRVMAKIELRKEYDVASYLFNTSTFASYYAALTGNDRWDDYVNSDPAAKVDTYKQTIQKNCGTPPNTLVIGKEVFDKLRRHPDVLDFYKYTKAPMITADMLAEYFTIPKVLVGEGVHNSAAENAAATNTYIWGKYALLAYISPTPAIDEPSFGYNFHWKLFGAATAVTKKWYDDDLGGDKIEVTRSYDPVLTAIECAYLLSTVIS